MMTTARDALRTTSIFRLRSLTNNLNFLNQNTYKMTCDSKINLYMYIRQSFWRKLFTAQPKYFIKYYTVYIHSDSFPIKSAFLPPFRNASIPTWFIFITDREYVLSIYLLIAILSDWKHRLTEHNIHTRNRNKILRDLTGRWFYFQRTTNICYISKQHQEGKFQKRDVSRVTCLSKAIAQQV